MNFETVLFAVAFLLLAALSMTRNEAPQTDRPQIEEAEITAETSAASEDVPTLTPKEPNLETEATTAGNE